VGTLLDATVFIDLERAVRTLPANSAMTEVSARLVAQLGADETSRSPPSPRPNCCTACTAPPRSTGPAARLSSKPSSPRSRPSLDMLTARAHARIWAELAGTGKDVGAHDRIVAATAIAAGWRVGTANTAISIASPASTSSRSPSPANASSPALRSALRPAG